MGSREELQALYREALRLGDELLRALQGELTEEGLARVEALIEARSAVAQRASTLFDPALRDAFRSELEALMLQQRALEAQMGKVREELQSLVRQTAESRNAMEGVRRLLKNRPVSRWINEKI